MTALTDILWAQASERLFVTKEQWLAGLDGWQIEPIEVEGAPAFATLIKGPEFHFASFKTGHKIPLGVIRERLGKLIEQHGHATTRTPHEEKRQHSVNRLLGFVRVGGDAYDVHYRMESLRSKPCPSSP